MSKVRFFCDPCDHLFWHADVENVKCPLCGATDDVFYHEEEEREYDDMFADDMEMGVGGMFGGDE